MAAPGPEPNCTLTAEQSAVEGSPDKAYASHKRRFRPICDIGRTAIAYRTFAASEIKLGGRTFRNLISALLINARWALSGHEARFVNVVALVDKPANRSNSWTMN